jgi:glycosyltransferase involved in cell wall biosynthesis
LEQRLDWNRFEWTFVGRSPERFDRIRMLPPVPSRELGELVRCHDVYVTASLHESCSNGLLEALACGLPALYVRSGSNGELVGEGGVGYDAVDELPDALDRLVAELPERRRAVSVASLSQTADAYLEVLGTPTAATS